MLEPPRIDYQGNTVLFYWFLKTDFDGVSEVVVSALSPAIIRTVHPTLKAREEQTSCASLFGRLVQSMPEIGQQRIRELWKTAILDAVEIMPVNAAFID